MELFKSFCDIIRTKLDDILETQMDNLDRIADLMYDALTRGNVIHLFGTGHSHILAEECFFRAGGLVPVNAILEESLMLHNGAMASSHVERLNGYADIILKKYNTNSGDLLFIFSNSGINSVPIEMAIAARNKGLKVVAVTNIKQSKSESPRHESGKRLFELADFYIDNCGDIGDAALSLGRDVRVAPLSTITGAAIMHGLFAEAADRIMKAGGFPPVYMSANIQGGSEYNAGWIEKYKDKLKYLI
jgi:uncharacterized phosphosugar-binding protein